MLGLKDEKLFWCHWSCRSVKLMLCQKNQGQLTSGWYIPYNALLKCLWAVGYLLIGAAACICLCRLPNTFQVSLILKKKPLYPAEYKKIHTDKNAFCTSASNYNSAHTGSCGGAFWEQYYKLVVQSESRGVSMVSIETPFSH